MKGLCRTFLLFGFCFAAIGSIEARAEYVDTDTAILRTLDKVTGRTATLNVKTGEVAAFGTLNVKVNVCKTKPPEETPENAVFLEIYNKERRDKEEKLIFSGWMFSSSPALSALENSTYDVWLLKCGGDTVALPPKESAENEKPAEDESEPEVVIGDDVEPEVVVEVDDSNDVTVENGGETGEGEDSESVVAEPVAAEEDAEPVVSINTDENEPQDETDDENESDAEPEDENADGDESLTEAETLPSNEEEIEDEAEVEVNIESENNAESEVEEVDEDDSESTPEQ